MVIVIFSFFRRHVKRKLKSSVDLLDFLIFFVWISKFRVPSTHMIFFLYQWQLNMHIITYLMHDRVTNELFVHPSFVLIHLMQLTWLTALHTILKELTLIFLKGAITCLFISTCSLLCILCCIFVHAHFQSLITEEKQRNRKNVC